MTYKKDEEIRNKKIKDLTKEDLKYILLRLIQEAEEFPCGYSHTYEAYYQLIEKKSL